MFLPSAGSDGTSGISDQVGELGRFVGPQDEADVAVLIVTYQNGGEIASLIGSLRAEACDQRLRVVVADNASTDDTLGKLAAYPDVLVCATGGNLGYAAGVNVAARHAGDVDALLVLNADLEVRPGSIWRLRHRQKSVGAGVVVPRIRDSEGRTYHSLRREPSLIRGLGDAVFGRRWPSRPALLSEIVRSPGAYDQAHIIDWATGAALLIDRDVARRVGDWDESFFLYSEETDFLRRVREVGATIWYEPEAVVHHSQGGSGSSVALEALMAVNRIRYAAKHAGRPGAFLTRAVVALHELARSMESSHRTVLRIVLSKHAWGALPAASRNVTGEIIEAVHGSIVIPAHNEAAGIGSTLDSLAPLALSLNVDVVVVANGCADDTVAIAQSKPGVKVLELREPSKTSALNLAEMATARWPRIYLDADIRISLAAVCDTLTQLDRTGALAGRPPYLWVLDGVSWPVRAYYHARNRIPSAHLALWGAGVYALSADGRRRFGAFPDIVADDLFVDNQFAAWEKQVVQTDPVRVSVPRSARSLLKVLRRQNRGAKQLRSETSVSTFRELAHSITGPWSLLNAVVYAGFSLLSRSPGRCKDRWERDESSRSGKPPGLHKR